MGSEFRVKWLLYVLNKNGEQGFSWVWLVYVMLILGVLAAIYFIYLPEFLGQLGQANKGKQVEAKQYVSVFNKAQQAYYTENGKFVTDTSPAGWASLAVGFRTQTANYKYSISANGKYGVDALADSTQITAETKMLKNYTGTVGLVDDPSHPGTKTSHAIVCETQNAGVPPVPGIITATGVQCGKGMNLLSVDRKLLRSAVE